MTKLTVSRVSTFSLLLGFALGACTPSDESGASDQQLARAESFIDAFYSFEPAILSPYLSDAGDSASAILYYQGWAEGGNYQMVKRQACEPSGENLVSCSITVEDDPILALGIDFRVTDTFTIEFDNTTILSVETSSDDPDIYYTARDWVRREVPELIAIPCEGFFAGGPTPGDCARAMAAGYAQFAASADFPN